MAKAIKKTSKKNEISVYPGRQKTDYAIICTGPWDMPEIKGCGRVYLTEEEWDSQMMNIEAMWKCPICCCQAWPDESLSAAQYEAYYKNESSLDTNTAEIAPTVPDTLNTDMDDGWFLIRKTKGQIEEVRKVDELDLFRLLGKGSVDY